MSTSVALSLYSHLFEKRQKLTIAVIYDLFGFQNWTSEMKNNEQETLDIFTEVYRGLFMMGVTTEQIMKAFRNDELDNLIHTEYNKSKTFEYNSGMDGPIKLASKTGYYKRFCKKNIKIGKNKILNDQENELEEDDLILSDDADVDESNLIFELDIYKKYFLN